MSLISSAPKPTGWSMATKLKGKKKKEKKKEMKGNESRNENENKDKWTKGNDQNKNI